MNGLSTLTQKGQVVIPQNIRDHFNLKPSRKIYFEVVDNKILVSPIMTLDEAFGMIKTKIPFSKEANKRVIEDAVVKKFKNKNK